MTSEDRQIHEAQKERYDGVKGMVPAGDEEERI